MANEQKAKLSKAYDYREGSTGKMVSYPAGYEGTMPQKHYDAAVAAGAVEGAKASTTTKDVQVQG